MNTLHNNELNNKEEDPLINFESVWRLFLQPKK